MGWFGLAVRTVIHTTMGGTSGRQLSLAVQLDGNDLIFKNLAWLRLDVLAMGSSFTVKWSLRKRL